MISNHVSIIKHTFSHSLRIENQAPDKTIEIAIESYGRIYMEVFKEKAKEHLVLEELDKGRLVAT